MLLATSPSPKICPERLRIVQVFWQLISLNREDIGRNGRKDSILCKCSQIGYFEIGQNTIEETDDFLRNYKLSIVPTRTYDPYSLVLVNSLFSY